MKTVIVCANDFYPNNVFGLGDSVYDIVEHLKDKYNFIVITTNKEDVIDMYTYPVLFLDQHLDKVLMNGRNNSFKIFKSFDNVVAWNQALFIKTTKYLKANQIEPDIIINNSWVSWKLAQMLKGEYDIPIINVVHFYEKQYEESRTKISLFHKLIVNLDLDMFKNADCNVVFTENMLKNISDKYGITDLNNFRVIPHSIDIHSVVKKPIVDSNNIKFLYVGRLSEEKGIKELLEVFAELSHKYNNISLMVVGNGVLFDELQVKYKNSQIKFVGKLSHEKLYSVYNESNVVIVPSLTETFGLVLLEALYFEKAIITTTGITVSDIVPGNVAITVPLDVQAEGVRLPLNVLRNSVERVILNPDLINQMSKASKDYYMKKFFSYCEYTMIQSIIEDNTN